MKQWKVAFSVFLSLFLVSALTATASPGTQSGVPVLTDFQEIEFVPGEILVGYTDSISKQQYTSRAYALAEKVNATIVEQYDDMVLLQTHPADDLTNLWNFERRTRGRIRPTQLQLPASRKTTRSRLPWRSANSRALIRMAIRGFSTPTHLHRVKKRSLPKPIPMMSGAIGATNGPGMT